MEDLDDSADDLFITQSTFRVDSVSTQHAEDAANFFLDSDDDFLNKSFHVVKDVDGPKVVQYWDFSNTSDKGYTLMSDELFEEKKKQAAFQPLFPDLFDFMHDKVTFLSFLFTATTC